MSDNYKEYASKEDLQQEIENLSSNFSSDISALKRIVNTQYTYSNTFPLDGNYIGVTPQSPYTNKLLNLEEFQEHFSNGGYALISDKVVDAKANTMLVYFMPWDETAATNKSASVLVHMLTGSSDNNKILKPTWCSYNFNAGYMIIDFRMNLVDLPTVMTGATADAAGTSGLVPSSSAGDQNKYLKADGTWDNDTIIFENDGDIAKFSLNDIYNAYIANKSIILNRLNSNYYLVGVVDSGLIKRFTFTNCNGSNIVISSTQGNYECRTVFAELGDETSYVIGEHGTKYITVPNVQTEKDKKCFLQGNGTWSMPSKDISIFAYAQIDFEANIVANITFSDYFSDISGEVTFNNILDNLKTIITANPTCMLAVSIHDVNISSAFVISSYATMAYNSYDKINNKIIFTGTIVPYGKTDPVCVILTCSDSDGNTVWSVKTCDIINDDNTKIVSASTSVTEETNIITNPLSKPLSDSALIYQNGVLLQKNTNYSISSDGSSIILNDYNAVAGDVFTVILKTTGSDISLNAAASNISLTNTANYFDNTSNVEDAIQKIGAKLNNGVVSSVKMNGTTINPDLDGSINIQTTAPTIAINSEIVEPSEDGTINITDVVKTSGATMSGKFVVNSSDTSLQARNIAIYPKQYVDLIGGNYGDIIFVYDGNL